MSGTGPLDEILAEARDLRYVGPAHPAAHRRHAEAFAPLVPPAASAVDLGSGAGLPGLVLAVLDPSVAWTLVEGSTSRTRFLERAVSRLGLQASVVVVGSRAELVGRDPEYRCRFDLVTARSFGPPAVVAECAAPLLRNGGRMVVSEPPDGEVSDRWPASGLSDLGFGAVNEHRGPPRLVEIVFTGPCPARAPRRVGIPAKRPWF